MCLECGFYKGRMVVDMAAKKKAREARLQAKRERIEGEQQAYGEPEAAATDTKELPAQDSAAEEKATK
jgi:hypothetical protein